MGLANVLQYIGGALNNYANGQKHMTDMAIQAYKTGEASPEFINSVIGYMPVGSIKPTLRDYGLIRGTLSKEENELAQREFIRDILEDNAPIIKETKKSGMEKLSDFLRDLF